MTIKIEVEFMYTVCQKKPHLIYTPTPYDRVPLCIMP